MVSHTFRDVGQIVCKAKLLNNVAKLVIVVDTSNIGRSNHVGKGHASYQRPLTLSTRSSVLVE